MKGGGWVRGEGVELTRRDVKRRMPTGVELAEELNAAVRAIVLFLMLSADWDFDAGEV